MIQIFYRSFIFFVWFLFYFLLSVAVTLYLSFRVFGFYLYYLDIIVLYIFLFFLSFTPLAEYLWRLLSGLRPLRIKAEKDRLTQLFEEVYNSYTTEEKKTKHTKKIKLFIEESMNINAYAFGRRTLVLTKGCIDLLSDESLKGLIAHELGHFHNRDGIWKLFTYVANLPLSLLMKILHKIDNSLSGGVIKFVFNIIFSFFRLIEFVGDLIIMHESRTREYEADQLALDWGYGGELANALIELYQISMEKPKSINEMLKATHPPITKRIEELETLLY